MINFDNIKIIKKINAGMLGTTYLCEYKKKYYALKIQHILEKDQIEDYNNEMWREIDLYKFIDKMPNKDKIFFTKLYGYKIYNNCTHKQIRPYKIDLNDTKSEFAQRLKQLDESDWCVKFLLEYKGKSTLSDFLVKYYQKLKLEQIYSILLQIIHIIMLLHNGGYSHNDLHTSNIMISKTNKTYFIMNGIKIKYFGYQISAIDYGNVLHKKYKIEYTGYTENFLTNNDKWLLSELNKSLTGVISNEYYKLAYYKKLNKELPWETNRYYYYDTLKLIFQNHIDFCNEQIIKYIKIFPHGKKAIKQFYTYYNTTTTIKEIRDIIGKEDKFSFVGIINLFFNEFELTYPELFNKYSGWDCKVDWMLPKNECLEILLLDTPNNFINYFLNKI